MIVYDRKMDHLAAPFVKVRVLSEPEDFGPCYGFSFVGKDRQMVAGCVFHNYSPSSGVIEVSAASDSPRWLSRVNMSLIFNYVFDHLGCRMATARHSETNRTAIRLWARLGATQHTLPNMRADGEDEVVAILTKQNWLNSKFRRET